jgi:hypothetical protein
MRSVWLRLRLNAKPKRTLTQERTREDKATSLELDLVPNVMTGNLRRSIYSQTKIGFGNGYVAEVGASMVYARAVELGLPEWKSGVKYPYLAPAAESLKQSGKLNRTFTGAFVQYLRG